MPNIDKAKNNGSKKRLGRGLGSLLETSAADFEQSPQVAKSPKKTTPVKPKPEAKTQPVPTSKVVNQEEPLTNRVINLAIEKIFPNSDQPRKDFLKEPLEELANSIKVQGVLQPITVRKKGTSFEIVAGERRWRASQIAGLDSVPAIVKDIDDQKSMELALIENLQREDLNIVEEAMGYQLLIDEYDLSQQELAQKIGKSRSAITNSLRVLVLPRDVKEMLRQSLITFGHAKVLLGVEDPKVQTKLARKTVQKKLSVRALEKEVIKTKSKNTSDSKDLDVSDKLVDDLAIQLQKKLGTKVKIQYSQGKGKVLISFYSDEELNKLADQLKK